MKKLKLAIDQIQVLSFAVETTKSSRGTVNGFAPDTQVGCGGGGRTDFDNSCFVCEPEPISWETNCGC